MEAIILCGGLGTRLRSMVSDVPKSMAPINGKPFLLYMLDKLADNGVDTVIFAVGYKKEIIQDYFKDEYKNIKLIYSQEEQPLGTGGAIKQALKFVTGNSVFIINGDDYVDIDINELYEQHNNSKVALTIAVKPMENYDRYGSVVVENGLVKQFVEKQPTAKGLINVGSYMLNKNIFDGYNLCDAFSFENDFLVPYAGKVPMGVYVYNGYFIDIGLPDDYLALQNYLNKEKNHD